MIERAESTKLGHSPYFSCNLINSLQYEVAIGKSKEAPYREVTAASFGPGNLASGWRVSRYKIRAMRRPTPGISICHRFSNAMSAKQEQTLYCVLEALQEKSMIILHDCSTFWRPRRLSVQKKPRKASVAARRTVKEASETESLSARACLRACAMVENNVRTIGRCARGKGARVLLFNIVLLPWTRQML